MYRRVLVPLDGSRLAEVVLPVAERLARDRQACVILLHVLERGAPAEVHGEHHLQARDEAEAYLQDVAARLRAKGISVESHTHEVPEGDVPRSIAAHVAEEKADLILLSTHGSGGVRQLLFGSIAQQVLKRGTVPVLLARPAPDGSAYPFQPNRVLVPLDGTAAAEMAIAPAQQLAALLGASLHLVMVVATPGTMRGDLHGLAQVMPTATRAALELEEEEACDYLEVVAERLRRGFQGPESSSGDPLRMAVTTEVRRGDTLEALADEASEPGVGLVVVATHGRAGVQAIWAGSVTARLLSRTHAPLLLLRMIES